MVTIKYELLLNQIMYLWLQYCKDCIELLVKVDHIYYTLFNFSLIYSIGRPFWERTTPLSFTKVSYSTSSNLPKFGKTNVGVKDNFLCNKEKLTFYSSPYLNFIFFKNSVICAIIEL